MTHSNHTSPTVSDSACACGHAAEEHGGDPKWPGSSACQIAGCDCVAYESADPPCASVTEKLHRYLLVRPFASPGNTNSYELRLVVGAYQVSIGPERFEIKEHAEWLRRHFLRAIDAILNEPKEASTEQYERASLSLSNLITATEQWEAALTRHPMAAEPIGLNAWRAAYDWYRDIVRRIEARVGYSEELYAERARGTRLIEERLRRSVS